MPPKEFTPAEESIIKNMMLSKSHKDIADLLACEKSDVAELIFNLTVDTGIVTYQMKLNQRAAGRSKPVKVKPVKIKKERLPTKAAIEKERRLKEKISQKAHQQMMERNRIATRHREPEFKTRYVDYSEMMMVKVDHKTFISVPKGSDIEAIKKKYLKRAQDYKTEATHYKVVKKPMV